VDHDYDEPAAPVALVRPASPTLAELGEAHFWPHARAAGDLTSPGTVKIVTRGDGVWPVDELIPALYMDHPRADIRLLYPKRLRAYALEPPLVTQLPKEEAGSDTEASGFALSSGVTPGGSGM
jgi:hypothetical protein